MNLIERIKRHEGFVKFPKLDVAPYYVVGYGHDIPLDEVRDYSNGITEDEAMDLLVTDLDIAKSQVASAFPWILGLDENRVSVLTEMAFQLGIGGVQKFKRMIAAIRDQDYETAANEMLNSSWHTQTPKRCEELARIMRTGG